MKRCIKKGCGRRPPGWLSASSVCVYMHVCMQYLCAVHTSVYVHLEARGPYCLCDRVSSLTLKLALAGWPVSARIQDPPVLYTSPTHSGYSQLCSTSLFKMCCWGVQTQFLILALFHRAGGFFWDRCSPSFLPSPQLPEINLILQTSDDTSVQTMKYG